jgi:hypothetical protein
VRGGAEGIVLLGERAKAFWNSYGAPVWAEKNAVNNGMSHKRAVLCIDDMVLNADYVSSHFANAGVEF